MGVASKLFSVGAKFLQKAAPKVAAAGEKLLPKVTAAGEKVMGKIPGIMSKAQEGIAKAWGKTGSFLASPATKSTIEGVGKGVAKGFGKVGSWMASHPLGTAKLAATGFVGFEANKFLTNTTGKGLAEHVAGGVQAIDNVASGKPVQAGKQTGTQAGPAGLVNGIMSTVTGVFNTVSNVVGGLVGDKNMGGLLTALGVGAAGVFGLKRVGILAPLAIAGAGLFAANQAGLFKGAQQPGSPIASQTHSGLSKIAFAPYTGTGVQTGTSNPSTGLSGLQETGSRSRWDGYDPRTVAGLAPAGARPKLSLDTAKMLSGAGLASGVVAAASGLESKSEKSAPAVTVEAEADDVPTKSADLGPTQLA